MLDNDVNDFVDGKTLPIESYLRQLRQQVKQEGNKGVFLPQNCRYFYRQPFTKETLFVLEQPPALRTIFSSVSIKRKLEGLQRNGLLKKWGYEYFLYHNSKPYQFMLAFPYMVYFIKLNSDYAFRNMTVFCRNTPLQGNVDYLCKVPLSNIDESQYVCLGDVEYTSNIVKYLENVIRAFWQNTFNDDFLYNINDYASDKYLCDFITWEYMSKQDPMFIYRAGWLKWHETFGQHLQHHIGGMEERVTPSDRDSNNISWRSMLQAFQSTVETSKYDEETDSEMLDNLTDSVFLDSNVILYQGDSIFIKNKRYFVESIGGPAATLEPDYIKLRDNKGRLIYFKLTEKSKKFLYQKVIERRYITTFNFDGQEIKSGQIVEIGIEGVGIITRKVDYFRYSFDGTLEMRTTSSFIMMDKIKSIKKIEIDDVFIDGIKLIEGNRYIIKEKISRHYGLHGYYTCVNNLKYIGIDLEREGSPRLSVQFQDDDEEIVSYPYNEIQNRINIVDYENLIPLPKVFRVGNLLCDIPSQYKRCYEHENLVVIENNYFPSFSVDAGNENMKNIAEKVLIGDSFILRGIPFDLMFSIGDQVVVSDWDNPLEMLKIKTVMGFIVGEDSISIALEDKHGEVTRKEIIRNNYERRRTYVDFNDIRHIKTEHEGIRNGSKIIAKEVGIANFPKKDRNIIIGFLEGTEVPQVLCSNACTLWFDEMIEKFEIIDVDDKRYKRFKHSPIDLTKIKPQQGDLMAVHSEYGQQYMVTRNPYYGSGVDGGLYMDYISEPMASAKKFQMDSYHRMISQFKGFLSPRMRKNQIEEFPARRNIIPRFNGEYNTVPSTDFTLEIEARRIRE